ncbi:hypothetical protein FQN60_008410, partial [Etheostoma spectabile]
KVGKKRDLTGSEKSNIVKCLSEGCSTLEVAKILRRDHQTIKRFDANSQQGRKKRKCNLPGVSRSTRCSVLRDVAQVRKAETRPPLNKTHKVKRQDWAKKYLKTDFSKVLWTDEMRVTLDGPDGWARGWISNGHRAPLRVRRQQGGAEVLDELVGPFRVEDGLKINFQNYCQVLKDTFFKQWYRKKSLSFKKAMIKKLTDSMDGRLITVIEKKGGYVVLGWRADGGQPVSCEESPGFLPVWEAWRRITKRRHEILKGAGRIEDCVHTLESLMTDQVVLFCLVALVMPIRVLASEITDSRCCVVTALETPYVPFPTMSVRVSFRPVARDNCCSKDSWETEADK